MGKLYPNPEFYELGSYEEEQQHYDNLLGYDMPLGYDIMLPCDVTLSPGPHQSQLENSESGANGKQQRRHLFAEKSGNSDWPITEQVGSANDIPALSTHKIWLLAVEVIRC